MYRARTCIYVSLSIKIDRYSLTHGMAWHGTARNETEWNERNSAHTRRKYGRLRCRWQRLNQRKKGRERARENQSRAAKKIYYYFSFSIIQLFGCTEYLCVVQSKKRTEFFSSFLFFKLTKNCRMPSKMCNHKKKILGKLNFKKLKIAQKHQNNLVFICIRERANWMCDDDGKCILRTAS